MIVDVHTHVADPSHYGEEFLADMGEAWSEVGLDAGIPDIHRQATSDADRVVVVSFDAPASGFVVPNEYVADYVATDPERLIGFASVDPNRENAVDILRWAVHDLGLRGLKIGPIYQHFDPLSSVADRLFAEAENLELPVLCHQGTTFLRRAPLRYARPWLLDEVAARHPRLVLYVAHLGHPWCEETIVVIRKHPLLFADVSALHTRPMQLYGAIRSAIEYGVADKLLFGSDYPFGTGSKMIAALREVSAMADRVGLPPIPMGVIDEIVHRSSLDLLGLA